MAVSRKQMSFQPSLPGLPLCAWFRMQTVDRMARNGDALTINFNSDVYEEVPDSDWHATVTGPMPITPPEMITFFLTRR